MSIQFRASNNLTPATLRIIRYTMFALQLLFGAIGYAMAAHPGYGAEPAANLPLLRWVGYGLCVLAMLATGVLRSLRARASDTGRLTLALVGSSFAEAAAMFGVVYLLMGGELWIYALGLLIFLATWSLLPADTETT